MHERDPLDPDEIARRREHAELLQRVRLKENDEHEAGRERSREMFEWWESTFGEKVRQWRRVRGWSQEELAEMMTMLGFDMHQTTVAKLERGARPLRVSEAVALSQVFGVPALAVFHGPGPEQEPWALERMRKHIENIEEGLQFAQEQLQERAKDVAYYETARASMAKEMLEAARKADAGELATEE